MSPVLRSVPLLAALLLAAPAVAQTQSTAGSQSSLTQPRNPGGVTTGTTTGNQGRASASVEAIDNKLLNQEKDRPRLPNQAPSPSQSEPGGIAAAPH